LSKIIRKNTKQAKLGGLKLRVF